MQSYREAKSKEEKRSMEKLINDIKSDFRSEIASNSKEIKDLNKWKGELITLTTQTSLFDKSPKEKKEFNLKVKAFTDKITKQEALIEEIKNNKIYENAFEWRFEFPEVLNNDGAFVGFDVVIGNPPYIRQEDFVDIKSYLKERYKIYNSIADLLTYFVELSYNILRDNGNFQFIISNKFTRANYGQVMRSYLIEKTQLTCFIDFSGLPVFDEATVDAAILGFCKSKPKETELLYADIKKSDFDVNDFDGYLKRVHQNVLQNALTGNTWAFENKEVLKIKQKVESQGIPLKDWDITINYGIKTGLNEAFVIEGCTRKEFISQDRECEKIIKPLLRGRDIQKYRPEYQDLWLIYIPKGYTIKSKLNLSIDNAANEPIPRYGYFEYDEAWDWFSQRHPLIAKHLFQFKLKAEKRSDMGDYWWEQRACAYLVDFEKPKIIYPNMTKYLPFVLDFEDFYYHNDKSFHIISESIYWLGAFLNSKLFKYCFRDNFAELLGGTRELRKVFFEPIPVKQISKKHENPFKKIVIQILSAKKQDSKANTSALEKEIDELVYQLYGLTEEEIKIVEGV